MTWRLINIDRSRGKVDEKWLKMALKVSPGRWGTRTSRKWFLILGWSCSALTQASLHSGSKLVLHGAHVGNIGWSVGSCMRFLRHGKGSSFSIMVHMVQERPHTVTLATNLVHTTAVVTMATVRKVTSANVVILRVPRCKLRRLGSQNPINQLWDLQASSSAVHQQWPGDSHIPGHDSSEPFPFSSKEKPQMPDFWNTFRCQVWPVLEFNQWPKCLTLWRFKGRKTPTWIGKWPSDLHWQVCMYWQVACQPSGARPGGQGPTSRIWLQSYEPWTWPTIVLP